MAKPPYVQQFKFPTPKGEVDFTSVVLDEEDFVALVTELEKLPPGQTTPEQWASACQRFREAKHIPMVGRGAKTEWLFVKFGATTPQMGILVRGQGPSVLQRMIGRSQRD